MKKIFLSILVTTLFFSCSDKDDDIVTPDENLEIHDFIWKSLNLVYYWQNDVPNLADSKASPSSAYIDFLDNYTTPESLFEALQHPEDRFSYITDDYHDLLNSQQGIFDSNGIEFGLLRFNGSNDVFGYVWYVLPDSDASGKDIQRGDIFTGVNGQTLNVGNYFDLLFGDNSGTYTLNMADISDNVISPNGEEVTLTKETNYQENPVYIAKTLDVNGEKVGYLMYNGFTAPFDDKLNEAFGQFKSDGVTDLILDLRYNPGGSVNSSANLASMISGLPSNDLFIKLKYNDKLSQFNVDYNFRSSLNDGEAINNLGLDRLYVITTGSTASASELIINGLNPYIDVIQIGGTTVGKNEASISVFDSESLAYDDDTLNPNHTYGMQPIVARNENSVGFNSYTDGFDPQIGLEEDLENMGVLGDVNEPLLARVIQEISGISARKDFTPLFPVSSFTNSKMSKPTGNNMYMDIEDLNISF